MDVADSVSGRERQEEWGEMNLTVSSEDGGTLSLISAKVSEGSD